MRTDVGFLNPDVFATRFGANAHWSEHTLAPTLWRQSLGFVNAGRVSQSKKLGDRLFSFEGSSPTVGDKVSIGLRGGYTLHTHNSTNVSYSNVTIHGASFMAITEFDGGGGHSYDNVRVVRRQMPAPTPAPPTPPTPRPPPSPQPPPSPTPSPIPGPPSEANYTRYAGMNSLIGCGATAEIDEKNATIGLSVGACEKTCDADPACGCVTYRLRNGQCYRRGGCSPGHFCAAKSSFDTYVKKTATTGGEPSVQGHGYGHGHVREQNDDQQQG